MTATVGSIITTSSYNDTVVEISKILNFTEGGYGSTLSRVNRPLRSTIATSNMVATAVHWWLLYDDVNRSIQHQTGASIPGLAAPVQGELITANYINTLAAAAVTAVLNSSTVHPSQLSVNTSTLAIIEAPWDSEIQIQRTYEWNSTIRPNHANFHFNLGGYVTSRLGVTLTGTIVTAQDQSFVDFVAHANSDYSPLVSDRYDRSRWLGPFGTTMTSYSTNTTVGVFTATVTYTRGLSTVTSSVSITPPAGTSPISTVVTPLSIEQLYYSTGAIRAAPPSVFEDRKILEVSDLAPFNFRAGRRSDPQILRISNRGSEPVTVYSIFPTQFGVQGFAVSTATNLSEQLPFNIPFNFNLTIAPNDDLEVLVYYTETVRATSEIGTFYNAIVVSTDEGVFTVPTEQNVSAPEFDFTLNLTDLSAEYTYTDWAEEYGLNTTTDVTLAINIVNTYYLPNTDFGIVGNTRLYGLFRKPDAAGLKFWVDRAKTAHGSIYLSEGFKNEFLTSAASSTGIDGTRVITANKFFDSGHGYGDFYDRTMVNTNISDGAPKTFYYSITPEFGSLRLDVENGYGYTASLSNIRFNGTTSAEAEAAFSLDQTATPGTGTILRGPGVLFEPALVNNTGTYSLDLGVTVYATDLLGNNVTVTKTENLTLEVTSLIDGNLVKWLSGFENDNAVVGMSYDRIGGQLYLTVGIGSGGDGAPPLNANGYLDSYVNVDYLGIGGDSKWGTFSIGFGAPMYRISAGGWGAFMNTYAVWPVNPTVVGGLSYPATTYTLPYAYTFTAPSTGVYTVEFAVDDIGEVSIGTLYHSSGGNFTSSASGTVSLSAGYHTVRLRFRNNPAAGGPGGIAVTIRNSSGNIVWSTLDTVRTSPPYPYWPEVYRIPIVPGVARSYRLESHNVKLFFPVAGTGGLYSGYSAYFGAAAGSPTPATLISIDSDGKGNLTFNWNRWDIRSGNSSADTTMANLQNMPYSYSLLPSRRRQAPNAVPGPTTTRLIGMTTRGPRYSTVITPGWGLIQVQSTVYDNNINGIGSTLTINGAGYSYGIPRGHTIFVINPLTFVVESISSYDTFGAYTSSGMDALLQSVADGKIIAIASADATTFDQSTRNILRDKFGSTFTATWSRVRIAHAFVGRANDPNFVAAEAVTSSTDLNLSRVSWVLDQSQFSSGIGNIDSSLFGTGGASAPIVGTDGGPPPAPDSGSDCFTANTLVTMSDGTLKRIVDIEVGELVLSHDGTRINKVKFIERVKDSHWEYLYSPSPDFEPFATINHPLYINGKLSSVKPDMFNNLYPWLGRTEEISNPKIVPASGDWVYNLWVDGDSTYIANGYGTTSIIDHGGILVRVWENGLMSDQQVSDIVQDLASKSHDALYGGYLINKYLEHIDSNFIDKLMVRIVKKGTWTRAAFDATATLIGRIARSLKD